jgi:hypothetical protein
MSRISPVSPRMKMIQKIWRMRIRSRIQVDDEAGDYRHSSAKRPWENYSRKTQYTMIKKLKAEIKGLNDDTAPR